MIKISCLIPSYKEMPRIKNVLCVVAAHPLIDEVVVIDDHSQDGTVELVREIMVEFPKVRLIAKQKNGGKTLAICDGIKEALGEYTMLIDADLIGITTENLNDLIAPVAHGKADVTVSIRGNTPWPWKVIGLDYISGERVMPRKFLLEFVDKLPHLPRFGLESYMNSRIIKNNFRVKIVGWPNVESPFKYKKDGLVKGVWGDIKMIYQIFQTITIFGPVYQIIRIKMLEVK